jgi:hypothetical protein
MWMCVICKIIFCPRKYFFPHRVCASAMMTEHVHERLHALDATDMTLTDYDATWTNWLFKICTWYLQQKAGTDSSRDFSSNLPSRRARVSVGTVAHFHWLSRVTTRRYKVVVRGCCHAGSRWQGQSTWWKLAIVVLTGPGLADSGGIRAARHYLLWVAIHLGRSWVGGGGR